MSGEEEHRHFDPQTDNTFRTPLSEAHAGLTILPTRTILTLAAYVLYSPRNKKTVATIITWESYPCCDRPQARVIIDVTSLLKWARRCSTGLSTHGERPCKNLRSVHNCTVSFLPCFNRITVLARNYFDSRRCHDLIRLHFEGRTLDDERPHIITQPVGMEVTLMIVKKVLAQEPANNENKAHL
jgi:hypothetical protein